MEGFQLGFSSDKHAKVWRPAVDAVKKFGFRKALIQQNTLFSKIFQVKHNFIYFAKKKEAQSGAYEFSSTNAQVAM